MTWDIRPLQRNLAAHGLYLGAIDNVMGPGTLQGLAEFASDGKAPEGTGTALAKWLPVGGIDNMYETTAFFAHGAHESGFRPIAENLNYSVQGLIDGFGRHRISVEDAKRFGRTPNRAADQQSIANTIYGGEWGRINLGNQVWGDGWAHRGMGVMQNTGKTSQAKSGEKVGLDLENHPELLLTVDGAIGGAVGFWVWKGLNAIVAQPGDTTEEETRKINGGNKGLEERRALKAKLRSICR